MSATNGSMALKFGMRQKTSQLSILHGPADVINSHLRTCHVIVPKIMALLYVRSDLADRVPIWNVRV